MTTEPTSLTYLRREFAGQFGACRAFSAPGRVNLIGEHTDYNEGFVLPMAIDRRTYVVGAIRPDRIVSVRSTNKSSHFSFDLDHPPSRPRGSWVDYVEGTAHAMLKRGLPVPGAELLISSDIPIGAGLSSSAALEISVAYAFARLAGVAEPDLVKLALSGQAAENEYVGARVGIMDQFIAALAEAGSALLIDCRSLEHRAITLELGTARILICDTRVKHALAASAYNERREQCEQGACSIRAECPEVRSLRDVSSEQLERSARRLPELIYRRCRHVIRENERTLLTTRALESGDLRRVGELFLRSHRSLRDDYEVSCPELDAAVDAAAAEPGVYGARMTGGGFGGSTITLLEESAVARVSAAIAARFSRQFGVRPEFFVSNACAGVQEHGGGR
ncbi:MAG: galactokinase [Polyangiaceae bacterium]